MKAHKFKIGQMVFVRRDDAPGDAYIVTQRLPEFHGSKDRDRVVRENELRYHDH
jgi:hypothetical protein